MPRFDDAHADVKVSIHELCGASWETQLRALVRVLGSIAVTLAMMYDQQQAKTKGP